MITTVSLFEQLAKEILDHYFKWSQTQDNIRPSWTNGLEIDRFYPNLGVAIEFQGPQHYRLVSSMQTREKFENQVKFDSLKRNFCLKKGVFYLPFSIFDFSEVSYLKTVEKIRSCGITFSRKSKDEITYNRLSRMLVGSFYDPSIFRRIEGIKNKYPK